MLKSYDELDLFIINYFTGGLVSNQVVLELLAAAMNKIENPTGFLIDGYVKKF